MTPEKEKLYGDILIDAILSLKDKKEARDFFSDLCTVTEINAMSQRFVVAKMLHENKTYQDISGETGASTATISRVSRALNFGKNGYLNAIKRLSD